MKGQRKILIAIAAFAISSGILLAGVVYPIFRGVVEDHEEILAQRRELMRLKEESKNVNEFEAIQSQYAEDFVRAESLLVDSKTPIAFFRFLDESAALFGLRIEKAPGAAQLLQGDFWPSFEIRLAGQGSYPSVMAFVERLENAPYLLEVKTLTLSAERVPLGQGNRGIVDFSLSLKVFAREI